MLDANKIMKISNLKSGFYDEIIVRRELSDNFCFYEPNYDNITGLHDWASATLKIHRRDKRDYIYSLEEFITTTTLVLMETFGFILRQRLRQLGQLEEQFTHLHLHILKDQLV